MERIATIKEAKKILGKDFIGPEELEKIRHFLKIKSQMQEAVPVIPFSISLLKKCRGKYVLILGVFSDHKGSPLTLNRMRAVFGTDPRVKEPCFYNQDWYLLHKFAERKTLLRQWYLIRKEVVDNSRGVEPRMLAKKMKSKENFPSAVLTAFAFFAYWFHTKGKILWKHDFIWCADEDDNMDRIYTGRYIDPIGKNKNGFNVHRHLSIRPSHGLAAEIERSLGSRSIRFF